MSQLQADIATALDFKLDVDQQAKFQALKSLQLRKIKALTATIDAKEKEIAKLKVLGKDNRRTQMIEALKTKIKDLELVIDVIKVELCKTFSMSPQEVNDFIIRKTISGPKRFRPATREELEQTISDLERKVKRLTSAAGSNASSVHGATVEAAGIGAGGGNNMRSKSHSVVSSAKSSPRGDAAAIHNGTTVATNKIDIAALAQIATMAKEIEDLKQNVEVLNDLVDRQKSEIARLRSRNSELRCVEDDNNILREQYSALKESFDAISDEVVDINGKFSQLTQDNAHLRSQSHLHTEGIQAERDGLYEQCETLVRQNQSLLSKLGDLEHELAQALQAKTGAEVAGVDTAFSEAKSHGSLSPASHDRELTRTITRLQEKLASSDKKCASLQTEVSQVVELRNNLRDKNIAMRDLQKSVDHLKNQLAELKSRRSTGAGGATEGDMNDVAAAGASDGQATEDTLVAGPRSTSGLSAVATLREENKRLREALKALSSAQRQPRTVLDGTSSSDTATSVTNTTTNVAFDRPGHTYAMAEAKNLDSRK